MDEGGGEDDDGTGRKVVAAMADSGSDSGLDSDSDF